MPDRYRKKPIVVEAMRYLPGNHGNCCEVFEFCGYPFYEGSHMCDVSTPLDIETLEGRLTASPGDWIVKGVAGEVYPVRADIFAATYEPVEEG